MIKEITIYTVICDGCGKDVHDGTEYSGFNDTDFVLQEASDSNWHVEEGKQYCPDCFEYDDEDNLVIKNQNQQ